LEGEAVPSRLPARAFFNGLLAAYGEGRREKENEMNQRADASAVTVRRACLEHGFDHATHAFFGQLRVTDGQPVTLASKGYAEHYGRCIPFLARAADHRRSCPARRSAI
jgi:hypothetical protein